MLYRECSAAKQKHEQWEYSTASTGRSHEGCKARETIPTGSAQYKYAAGDHPTRHEQYKYAAALTSGNAYSRRVRTIVMRGKSDENPTSISFFGAIERWWYL